jgi:penicillin-binding protein 1A
LSAQKQQQVFISLTGTDGKPVEGLQAGDVGITENDVNCKIIKVESIDWPTKLQVLVDNGRANTNPINPLRDGLKAMLELMPEGTEISLYTTSGTPRNIIKPTADKQKVIDGLGLKDVTLAEAALLAGIVQRPEDQSPFRNASMARARRATALRRMRAEGYITEKEASEAEAEPLPSAPALKETVVAPYFCEEIRQYLERTYGEKDLYRRGLRVDSTLDPDLQAYSEEALGWGLRRLARRHGFHPPRNLRAEGYSNLAGYVDPSWRNARLAEGDTLRGVVGEVSGAGAEIRIGAKTFPLRASGYPTGAKQADRILKVGDLVTVTFQKGKDGGALLLEEDPREQGSVMILENSTGAIRAMVGGYDWTQSKFNRSVQALRQAGSTFKPFVYLAALEAGYTPSDTIFDGPISIVIDPRQPPYRPGNYDRKFRGIVTLRVALEHSINVPTIRLAQLVGLSHVVEAAQRLGIRQKMLAYPSLALGAFEVTLEELTAAYSTFANQGLAFTPYAFARISDSNGDVLERTHPGAREVASPQACFRPVRRA